MKTEKEHRISTLSIAALGCLVVAVILTIGTLALGRVADRDTKAAVRNVSLLYLSELAGRREQVVSSILDDYIRDMDNLLRNFSVQSNNNTTFCNIYTRDGVAPTDMVLVHSLKSMSKSIGAMGLHEKAADLEKAGREGRQDVLQSDTEVFVRGYRALGEKLDQALAPASR
ncbi:MAG: Hpt domain-containing protein [Lachnospiraceae bacterium]|nr:Hpt domain-containing protein [Lachnospiraceae bacterium]